MKGAVSRLVEPWECFMEMHDLDAILVAKWLECFYYFIKLMFVCKVDAQKR